MTSILVIVVGSVAVCGSNKLKKKVPEAPPEVVWSKTRDTPILTSIQTNRLYQARVEMKRKLEDEKFIESLSKDPNLTQEFDSRNQTFEQQLMRTLSREITSGSTTSLTLR